MTDTEASAFVARVIERFRPTKLSGHLAIGDDSASLATDAFEFRLGAALTEEPVRVFFDQEGPDRRSVVELDDGRRLGEVMEESFGMEYFVADVSASFLISVNWYAIEFAGGALELRARLLREGR